MAAQPNDPLHDVYDDAELSRIDGRVGSPRWGSAVDHPPRSAGDDAEMPASPTPVPRYPVARRFAISGAMLAGAMVGVAEVFEPEPDRGHLIDYAPAGVDESQQLVTFLLVPGSPRRSRLVIRPWLLERHRRR